MLINISTCNTLKIKSANFVLVLQLFPVNANGGAKNSALSPAKTRLPYIFVVF